MVSVFSIRARNATEKGCASPGDGSNRSCSQTLAYSYPSTPSFIDIPSYDANFQWAQLAIKFGAVTPSLAIPGCDVVGYACINNPVKRAQMSTYVVRLILNDISF